MSAPFVVFSIEDSRYGINIGNLVEVIHMVALTSVPAHPAGEAAGAPVAGLVNVRGRVMPVLSLRQLLGYPASEVTTLTRMLVVRTGEEHLGLIVDSVEGVIHPDDRALNDPQTSVRRVDVVTAVYQDADGLVLLLDLDKLLARGGGRPAAGTVGVGGSNGTR